MIADLVMRGDWIPQAEALIDVRVTDTDASSHVNHIVATLLASAEEEKSASIYLLLGCNMPF